MKGTLSEIYLFGRVVKFSHTIFALPFAISMLLVVSQSHGAPSLFQLFYLILALVSARTMAMSFNRWLDRDTDAQNPRTLNREIPAGKIKAQTVFGLFLASALIFFLSSWQLGEHCLILAPLVAFILLGYSWTKRFTSSSHLILGLALSLAPGGVWYALTGEFAMLPVCLMLAVLFWVTGFDILYSCQDEEFDRAFGLKSIPALLGKNKAFQLAKLSHLVAVIFLAFFGISAQLGPAYFLTVVVFSSFMFSQYRLISPTNLEKINEAFFVRNGSASLVFLCGVALDVLLF